MHPEWHYEVVVMAEGVTDEHLESMTQTVRGVTAYSTDTKELRMVFRRSAHPGDPVMRGYHLVGLALTVLSDSVDIPLRERLKEFRVRRASDVM